MGGCCFVFFELGFLVSLSGVLVFSDGLHFGFTCFLVACLMLAHSCWG